MLKGVVGRTAHLSIFWPSILTLAFSRGFWPFSPFGLPGLLGLPPKRAVDARRLCDVDRDREYAGLFGLRDRVHILHRIQTAPLYREPMNNELCMKSFNCFGCQSGACAQFHPADPRATYATIAAFAARAEKDGVYVDPLSTTWTVCEVPRCADPVHVHAVRHVGPLDTRLCYDVLASRAG